MFEDLKTSWEGSSTKRKSILVGGVLLILVLFIGMSFWAMRADYQILFGELDPQDAAHMVAELDRMKTPYKLADNGTTILVESDLVYKTRLKLMSKGANLKGNVGFELFNTTDYGTTEFAQKINFQRALQGELARTIMAIDEVKHARVHIVLPEGGLFKKSGHRAKASVNLTMKGGALLSSEQIVGIQRLVAASVMDMDAAAVTVLDQRGVALSKNIASDAVGAATTSRMELKKEVENYLTKKVAALLDAAIGQGTAMASVDVTLNFDQVKVTREEVLPGSGADGQGAVLKRRQSEQGIALSSGARSSKSHSTDRPIYDSAGNGSRTVDVEYQNGRRVEQMVFEPGNIKRISIGVLIPIEMSEKSTAELRDLVASSIGLNIARGDVIAIRSIKPPGAAFSVDARLEEQKSQQNSVTAIQNATQVFEILVWLVLFLIIGGLAIAYYKRQKNNGALSRRDLSPEEREQLLVRISEWVGSPVPSVSKELNRS